MILECPSCQARFKVAEAQIPQAGRTVRCSKCAHAWHVSRAGLLPEGADATKRVADIPEPVVTKAVPAEDTLSPEARVEGEAFLSQLEAAINATEAQAEEYAARPAHRNAVPKAKRLPIDLKPFKIAVPTIATIWLVLAFVTYFPKWINAPGLSGIYRTFGIPSTEGLVFADVTMERERTEGGKTKFVLAGSIRNQGNATREVPIVRVALRNAKGDTIWGRSYHQKDREVKAGDVYPFRITNVETMFANDVKIIKVDMGNSLQLMVR